MSDQLEFDDTEFNIKLLLEHMNEHRTHLYPAVIDDFCRILKPRCVVVSMRHLIIEVDVTLLSGDMLQRLVDIIEPYILKDHDCELNLAGKKILIGFKKLKSTK